MGITNFNFNHLRRVLHADALMMPSSGIKWTFTIFACVVRQGALCRVPLRYAE